ncbi:MAG: glycosyltransferase family 39 protein [Candidatus Omnitrophica bacterium]|nr:glycosyltransferase family 39 protein [Candidatus Omnitrophota bacterium]
MAKLVLHLLSARGYGIHGDELYYIGCGDRLDWGYIDQPPFSILLLRLQRAVFGDSLLALRILPALAGSLTVLLAGLLARRMGARVFGQYLTEICVLVAGVYLSLNHHFSMNAFDILFWLIALHLVVRIIDGGQPFLWVWLGLVVGLGLWNKLSILFLCVGLSVGLMLTKERRSLHRPWLWAGLAS